MPLADPPGRYGNGNSATADPPRRIAPLLGLPRGIPRAIAGSDFRIQPRRAGAIIQGRVRNVRQVGETTRRTWGDRPSIRRFGRSVSRIGYPRGLDESRRSPDSVSSRTFSRRGRLRHGASGMRNGRMRDAYWADAPGIRRRRSRPSLSAFRPGGRSHRLLGLRRVLAKLSANPRR